MIRRLLIFCLIYGACRADVAFVTGVTGFGSPSRAVSPHIGIGLKFTNQTSQDIVATQLGRWVIAGNSQTHLLSIIKDDGTTLASVTVNCSGATPGQFLYGLLGTPCHIANGTTVYIISSETDGGSNDQWYDNNGTVITVSPVGVIGFEQSAYYNGGTSFFDAGNNGGTNTAAGPVDFKYSSPPSGWTKSGTVYTTDGAQFSVISAIIDATPGDTIKIPAGTFTYSQIPVTKAVTITGAGAGSTVINISASAPTFSSGGAFTLTAAATLANMTINQPGGANTTAIKADTATGWRITGITYNSAAQAGYFVYYGSYGLIDNCTVVGGSGSDEWIVGRGPDNSWTTGLSLGTVNATYIENCTLTNEGYNDSNSNDRLVIRFCTYTPGANYVKIDAHGYSTNSPPFSFRSNEAYNNTWTSGSALAMEFRGGTVMVFDNTTVGTNPFYLTDYGYQTNLTNWGVYQTPLNYPLAFQVGTGTETTINATALVAYQFATIASHGTTDFTAIGSANNNVGTQFTATAAGSGNGTVLIVPSTSPAYVWNNKQSGGSAPWVRTTHAVDPAAITLYQSQTGNPSATFTESDIIQKDRDFFASTGFDGTYTFDGSKGVGRGTKAQMLAITATKTGVGFWVTDEGSWNTTLPANTSGQLYTWNGSAWALKYTPFTYPHPLRGNTMTVGTLNATNAHIGP